MTSDLPSLDLLIAGLSDPSAYPHSVRDLRVIQTHISCVFLTGDYAYKIKKPVRFDFLDYHSLAKRYSFCTRELALNRRLCPSMYLDLVPITIKDGRIHLGGLGPPIEWAVKMRQLHEEDMLASRLAAGNAETEEIKRIAFLIADFHSHAATDPQIRECGMHGVVSRTVFNAIRLMNVLSANLKREYSSDEVRSNLRAFLKEKRSLFCRRMDEGCVRDCHGDLRAQNICLDPRFDTGIQVYDCIEFNDEFRYIDVAADLAYLAMDLDLAGRPDLSAILVDSYQAARPDDSLNLIVGFYKTYRACVRGNIAMLAAKEAEIPEPQREAHRRTSAAAYDLARCYSRARSRPALLITVGLSGTGKSRLARDVAGRLPAVVLSSDDIRKELAGVERTNHLDAAHYSLTERGKTYSELFQRARSLLERKVNVVLDATFLSARERDIARYLAESLKTEFWLLECHCPDAVVRQRLLSRETEPGSSDAGIAIYEQQLISMKSFSPHECDRASSQFHVRIDTDTEFVNTVKTVVDRFAGR